MDAPTLPILKDADVASLVSMSEAIDVIETALARKGRGQFVTPPRHYVPNKNGALVFTIGGDADEGAIGFRVYGAFAGGVRDSQVVAVFDAKTGALKGLVLGEVVGSMRTGAIGGVAMKHGARPDARVVGVIGSGEQARTQVEAAAAVRDLAEVRVYSRTPAHREAFAAKMSERLGLPVFAVPSAEEAVRSADIVVTATNSGTPLFDAALLSPGAHVNALGPTFAQRHELDAAVAERAASIFTDSPEQLRAYPEPSFLEGTPHIARVSDLAGHVAGGAPIRSSGEDITLFLSVGLSGTEVVLADLALSKVK
ncbi:MAG: ornithine cyclodeaminase family protein [Dehalococcoidia bacterium]